MSSQGDQHLTRAAWLGVLAFAILWAAKWPLFPLILDPSYHLLIARQMLEAGGPIAYEWWEAAPVGRVHLYPPVIHLLLAGLARLTGDLLIAGRLISILLPVAFVASVLAAVRRLAGPVLAAACVLVALMPYVFHVQMAVTLAGTLGMIELLWFMVAVREGRAGAAGALWVLLWYTHLTLPWVATIALLVEAIMQPEVRRTARPMLTWLVGVVPWWWHLGRHLGSLHITPRNENLFVELSPVMLCLAGIGLPSVWRARRTRSWIMAIVVGLLLFAPAHTYRWLNGEGMLGWILLAGAGIAGLVSQGDDRRRPSAWALWGIAAALLVASPTLAHRAGGWRWLWPDAAPWHLAAGSGEPRTMDAGYDTRPVREVLTLIRERTRPGEILWTNSPHVGGWIAAVAGRAMSARMLEEVRPQAQFDPVRAAHVLVWVKTAPLPGEAVPPLPPQERLEPVAETEIAAIWRQTGVAALSHAPVAVMPLALAWLLAGGVAMYAAWGLCGKGDVV